MNMRYTLLLLAFLFSSFIQAQITIEVTVLEGTSDSDCGDLIGSPENIWSVKVNEQDWTTFGETDFCRYESAPHLQFSETFSCPADLGELELCFRAFENDPSLFSPPCSLNPGSCAEEICEVFPIEEGTFTLALPNGGSASGEVQFEISFQGDFIGDANDLPCTAIDLGQLTANGTVGDASLSQFNNYCGTKSPDEPDPGDFLAPWRNNVGVWFAFTTSDEPVHRLQVRGTSDPENTGDPLQLQVGVFAADACDGSFTYLGGSGPSNIDNDFDEAFQLDCGPELQSNSTYYIVVDGVDDSPEQKNGRFGLEVQAIPLVPNEIDATLCFGESLDILSLSYDASGNYQDTISLADGCDTIIHASILVLEEIEIDINQLTEATDEGAADGLARASATGGAGDFSFEWSDGNREPSNGMLVGGETVSVTVTDANDCTAIASLFVEFLRPIAPMVVGDTLRCFGDTDGTITLSALEGKPPYTFVWEGLNNDISGTGVLRTEGEEVALTDLAAGDYSITISDNISANAVIIGTIRQPDELALNILENRAASCFGFCDGTLEIQMQGGTLPYSYDFPRGDFDLIRFSDLCAGDFFLTVTDGNNCQSVFNTPIEEPEEFIATADIQEVACFGGMDGAISVSTNGNPIAYDWNTGATEAELNELSAGEYILTVTNADNCQDTLSVSITQPSEALGVNIEIAEVISCFNAQDGRLEAQVSGPGEMLTYTWNIGQNTASISQLSPGDYRVVVENENGCITVDSISLTQPTELQIGDVEIQNLGCTDALQTGFIQLNGVAGGTPPYDYSIDGVRFASQARIENLFEGDYTAVVRDAQDCETEQDFSILPAPDVQVSLGGNRLIKLGETIELSAQSNFENLIYTWEGIDSLNCTNCERVEVMPLRTSTYSVQVSDPATECTASDVVVISISKERDVYIPNAFSPNADGINDYFTIYGGPSVSAVRSLHIFDRKGSLIYKEENVKANDPNTGWNGQFNGQLLRPSVFVYFAEVEFIDGSMLVYEGDVAIVR